MFSPDGYQALRRTAAVVRRGDRGVLTVTGADRLTWLQGLLTNDVAGLPPGGACDAAYLTPQGRMIAELRVINLADQVLLDVPGSLAESLRARLDALLFSEDAQITDRSSELAIVDLHGPEAPGVMGGVTPDIDDVAKAIVQDSAYGVPGYSLVAGMRDEDEVVRRLVAGGAVETTLETLDVVRVEAGRPAFLIDMDEQTIPLEAGIEHRTISFTKGCYVGQEVIVRVLHRGGGRVARKLVGFTLPKGVLPKAGDLVSTDREAGRLTSVAWSPALERGIALGYVRRDAAEPGTVVMVQADSGPIPATVTVLPFVVA
jgi:tRNA-modifying protein YgfZ